MFPQMSRGRQGLSRAIAPRTAHGRGADPGTNPQCRAAPEAFQNRFQLKGKQKKSTLIDKSSRMRA